MTAAFVTSHWDSSGRTGDQFVPQRLKKQFNSSRQEGFGEVRETWEDYVKC